MDRYQRHFSGQQGKDEHLLGKAPATKLQTPTSRNSTCSCGGICPRCRSEKGARIKTSRPNDLHEQKADDFANQQQLPGAETAISEPRSTASARTRSDLFSGNGKPLSETTRAHFEPRLGIDLGHVRMHTDNDTAKTARHLHAEAFTLGSVDISAVR